MDDYLKLMKEADDGVNATEPGMIFHTVNIDPEKKNRICWTELYQNDDAFFTHGKNTKLLDHVAKQADLQAGWAIEVYGSLKPETKDFIKSFGFPTDFHEIKLGYCRTCCLGEQSEGEAAEKAPASGERRKESDETLPVLEKNVAPEGGCFCA